MKVIKEIYMCIEYGIRAVFIAILSVQVLFCSAYIYKSIDLFSPKEFSIYGLFMAMLVYAMYVWMKYYFESAHPYRAVAGVLFVASSPFVVAALIIKPFLLILIGLLLLVATGIMLAIRDKSKLIPYRLLISVGAVALVWLVMTNYLDMDIFNNSQELLARRITYPYVEDDFDGFTDEQKDAFYTISDREVHFYRIAEVDYMLSITPGMAGSLNDYEYSLHGQEIKDTLYKDTFFNMAPGAAFIKKMRLGGSVRLGNTMPSLWKASPDFTIFYLYAGSLVNLLIFAITGLCMLVNFIKWIIRETNKKSKNKKGLPKSLLSVIPGLFIYIIAIASVLVLTACSIPGADIVIGGVSATLLAIIPVCSLLTTQTQVQD